jgi:hypothetical protein
MKLLSFDDFKRRGSVGGDSSSSRRMRDARQRHSQERHASCSTTKTR